MSVSHDRAVHRGPANTSDMRVAMSYLETKSVDCVERDYQYITSQV